MIGRRRFFGALAAAAVPARPNVLFIAVDDLNDWVHGFGGHKQTITPHIERLGRRGVRFQLAYCQAPMCNPSRASLLTGLRPTTTGVYTNNDTWRDGARGVVTLPEYFMRNGYRVEGAGKLFHASQTDFSCFHSYFRTGMDSGDAPKIRNLAMKRANIDWGPIDDPEESLTDNQVARFGAEFLTRKHAQPFFLGLGFIRPHLPWYAPRRYFEKFPSDKVELPARLENDLDDVPTSAAHQNLMANFRAIREAGKWKEAVAAYLACTNYTDDNVGRVLTALEASPHASNTIVVFLGDHGWQLGEKDHWQKFTLWERSCRAPLIVAAPGVAKRDADCRRVVEFLDIYPTLVDLCGFPLNPKLQGTSLRPLLRDPSREWSRPAFTADGADKISVRTGRWRYSRFPDGEELYDHDADPHEWTNMALKPQYAERKRELAALLPSEVSRAELRPWASLDAAEKKRLRGE